MDEQRNDQMLRETRWASWAIVAILIPAMIMLWGFSGDTADIWAWTIKPDMTPIFMGAGYGAGAYFFTQVARSRLWHPASAGVLSAAVFASLMLIVTFVHFEKFNHGDAPFIAAASFYAWTIVYIISPPIVGYLWFRNNKLDPRTAAAGDPVVSSNVRNIAQAIGIAAIALGLIILASPSIAIDNWGWKLTPLTARVLGCFTTQVGLGAFFLSRDQRWSSWRLLLQTFLVATALLLVGSIKAWHDFDTGSPATWGFIGGLCVLSAAVIALFASMKRQGEPLAQSGDVA